MRISIPLITLTALYFITTASLPVTFKENISPLIDNNMVLIPGGTFVMGTDSLEIKALMEKYDMDHFDIFQEEIPKHRVTVSPFYIDKYEVTNAQFKEFIDANPDWNIVNIKKEFTNGNYLKNWNGNNYPDGEADFPVIYVSWYSAMAYCHWKGGRLPTEAEWEFAARGGLTGKEFPWGDEEPDTGKANYSKNKIGRTVKAGSYTPNGYGLYDMAGNVWEYCIDEWKPYNPESVLNPILGNEINIDSLYTTIRSRRVIRGGSWGAATLNLRCSYRDSHPPEGAGNHVGFRCVIPFKN